MAHTNSDRLLLLLEGLSVACYRQAPKGAGLKTAITAREMGLVEFDGEVGAWSFRLTPDGTRFRRRGRLAAQAESDEAKARLKLDILNKSGPLDEHEMRHVRTHPGLGYELLARQSDIPRVVLDICLYHHERIDGKGYTKGLTGDQLSVPVRISTICDVYDALTTKRAYKKAWAPVEAARFMLEQDGQFDRRLLMRFFNSLDM